MNENESSAQVVIVGAGMAGLACARTLDSMGVSTLVLEASDRVGGRVGSRRIDGVNCELGFQVSMSNYTALERFVPRSQVPRHPFISGAVVVEQGGRCPIIDPRHAPFAGFRPWLKGLVGLRDLRAVRRCRARAQRPGEHVDSMSTQELIDGLGFSTRFIESFLRPFFGGVLLDEQCTAPASRFLRAFDRFAHGVAELPASGMQALPEAMAAPLGDRVRLNHAVESVDGSTLHLKNGGVVTGTAVVLALPWPVARRLLGIPGGPEHAEWFGTMALHFASNHAPSHDRLIHLNGTGRGWLNLACCPSRIAPGIAPDGIHSIIGSLRPGCTPEPFLHAPDHFIETIRSEVAELLELSAGSLKYLAMDVIPEALPVQTVEASSMELPDGVHLAGDWFINPSIDDAIESGEAAARAARASIA